MKRNLKGPVRQAMRYVAIVFGFFQVYTAGFGFLPDMQQRAVHVGFVCVLTFALLSGRKKDEVETKIPFYDWFLMVLAILPCVNAFYKFKWYAVHLGETTPVDVVFGVLLIIIVLEAGRRATGLIFPLLTLFMIIYAVFGPYFPQAFRHAGVKPLFIVTNLYQTWSGIWGFITGTSATILAIFIIFGTLIKASDAGSTFIDLANRLTGKMRGGPALVSVVASGLFGTISGSAAANVATTGNFTIPLMKRLGYRPAFAGGVEATASTGGQLAPPIMGVGAFIMSELLGISYLKVVVGALIPAVLFYFAVFISVRLEALRLNLSPLPGDQIIPFRKILVWGRSAHLFIPIVVLFYLLGKGNSTTFAGFYSIVSLIIIYIFSSFRVSDIKRRFQKIVDGFEEGAVSLIPIATLCVCANIVIAIVTQTGLGMKLTGFIMGAAGTTILFALIISALIALILGMGLPTAGAYMLAVSVVGPALIKLGISPLAAHLFVFYFAVISAITPPVCIAVFAGATIANAPWLSVAKVALRLALVAYFVPFCFVYDSSLLMDGSFIEIFPAFATASVGAFLLGSAMMGYFTYRINIFSRFFLFGGAICLLAPGLLTDAVGGALSIIGIWIAYNFKLPSLATLRAFRK